MMLPCYRAALMLSVCLAAGNAKLIDVADRIVLAYPVTDTFGKNVRSDKSSFLFKVRKGIADLAQRFPISW